MSINEFIHNHRIEPFLEISRLRKRNPGLYIVEYGRITVENLMILVNTIIVRYLKGPSL